MTMRGLGAVLVLALVGAAGGYVAGRVLEPERATVSVAAPVPASSPSIPVDPERPYAADIDYPPLLPSLSYRRHTLGDFPYEWGYVAPKGWRATQEGLDEIRWRPRDEPTVGGYSLRVKLISENKTPADMVAQKLAAMQVGYEDVEVLGQTEDLLSFSYRDSARDTLRFNTFRWFTITGETVAKFEMSIVGRDADRAGLDDLLEKVGASVSKVQ